jgi:hypothetical protein
VGIASSQTANARISVVRTYDESPSQITGNRVLRMCNQGAYENTGIGASMRFRNTTNTSQQDNAYNAAAKLQPPPARLSNQAQMDSCFRDN